MAQNFVTAHSCSRDSASSYPSTSQESGKAPISQVEAGPTDCPSDLVGPIQPQSSSGMSPEVTEENLVSLRQLGVRRLDLDQFEVDTLLYGVSRQETCDTSTTKKTALAQLNQCKEAMGKYIELNVNPSASACLRSIDTSLGDFTMRSPIRRNWFSIHTHEPTLTPEEVNEVNELRRTTIQFGPPHL